MSNRFEIAREYLRAHGVAVFALLFAVILARRFMTPGYVGYAFDWNVPATAPGLWAWGISDVSPWRPIEFGMPLAYPTETFLKLGFALLGLAHILPSLAIFAFLVATFTLASVGASRIVRDLFCAGPFGQVLAGALYVASPFCFNSTVTGYITTLLSYAAFPWVIVSLAQAHRGERHAWWRVAFWCAVSFSQIQYAVFDTVVALPLLIALRASLRQYIAACAAALLGFFGCYLFLYANLFFVRGEFARTLTLSQHSWTDLNAPGIWKAIAQQPSFYSFFVDATGVAAPLWSTLGGILTILSLIIALASRNRIAQAFAVVAVLLLAFLNGTNPPLGFIVAWLYAHVPAMTLLRNMNYLFAVLSLLIAVLLFSPRTFLVTHKSLSIAFAAFALIWTMPFWGGLYAKWIPVVNDSIPQVTGQDGRRLVWPHLSTVGDGRALPSGVNPNAVETITPIFVRDTPSGVLEASLLDRATDWAPLANSIADFMAVGRVGYIDLQEALESHFSDYVDSYGDPWLAKAYRTRAIHDRLLASGMLYTDNAGLGEFGQPGRSDTAAANSYVLLNEGLQLAGALESLEPHLLGVETGTLDDLAVTPAVGGFVRTLDSPALVVSRSDFRQGVAFDAGSLAAKGATDFHSDWVDQLSSQDWWLSSRILQQPHAAVTQSTATLSIPLQPRHVRVFLQYFTSLLGGAIEVRAAGQVRTVDTSGPTFGEYHWLDLGWLDGKAYPSIEIHSEGGLNAIGKIIALPVQNFSIDSARYRRAAQLPQAALQPDISIPGSYRVRIEDPAQVILSAPSVPMAAKMLLRLVRSSDACDLRISNVQLRDYSVRIDGKSYSTSAQDTSLVAMPCTLADSITIDRQEIGNKPILLNTLTGYFEVERREKTGSVEEHTVYPRALPLAFPLVARGLHTLTISRTTPLGEGSWTFKDAQAASGSPSDARAVIERAPGQTFVRFASDHHVVEADERWQSLRPRDSVVLAGTYDVDPGSVIRIVVFDPKGQVLGQTLLSHRPSPSTFVFRVSTAQATHASLSLRFDPGTGVFANGWVRMGPPLANASCNLGFISPRFQPGNLHDEVATSQRFQRYKLTEPGPVVQYAQTYNDGWLLSGADAHMMSVAGFNLWLHPSTPKSDAVIMYKSAVAYSFLLVASSLLLLTLFVGGFVPVRSRNVAPR